MLEIGNNAAAQETAAQSLSADPILVMSGRLNPATNQVEFYRTAVLDPSIIPLSKRLEITLDPANRGGAYTLRQFDAGQRLLSSHFFDMGTLVNQDDKYTSFGFAAAYAPNAVSFEIWRGELMLGRIQASAHAPRITLLSPNGGESIGDEMEIAWSASDADGDGLLFDVQYSADNGRSWQLLAGEVISQSITVATDAIPGSVANARIRVVAHDGLRTSYDSSEQRFTVAAHPPRLQISSPQDGDLLREDTPLILRGEAWDAEDGQLTGRALSWLHVGHGAIGSGETVFLEGLRAGEHTLTFSATDSDGRRARSTVKFTVYDEMNIYLPMLRLRQ